MPHLRREELSLLIERVQRSVLSVYVVPNVAQVNLLNSELLYLFYEEMFLLGIHNNLKSPFTRWTKTSFDVVAAFLLCIPLLPLMAGIAVLVAASSPGPILFTQAEGPGVGADPFRIYKFRTMVEGADLVLERILEERPELRLEYEEKHKLSCDPRTTPIGRFLRKTSLDELPQIINVLKGEMSLVGPRPVTREELDLRYREAAADYCLVKPGMTGLWQVSGRSERGYDIRVRLDLWYLRNWSLWLDLVILVRTVGVVLGRKGAV
ncbi:MAG: Undecaprenyl-phosphate galactose phosphotransferase [Leptospirillum sp. Group IV 'UBA BS']|nr:MAG: Undecaprenyl-phosphate galactose phosphotransferase [Leptospirillum sp. Group IV 'UBA BS']